VQHGPKDLEDYGYLVEQAILVATDLRLGTCWLGGTFTKGRFAARMCGLERDETMPAVVSLGAIGDDGTERIREREAAAAGCPPPPCSSRSAGGAAGTRRGRPLRRGSRRRAHGAVGIQQAAVARGAPRRRLAFLPAAHQGYGKGSALFAVLRLADLQRVDLGIALCHFELAAASSG